MIEGDARTLRLVGELIPSVAEDIDCSFDLYPFGAHFSYVSQLGLTIHRLPCVDERLRNLSES